MPPQNPTRVLVVDDDPLFTMGLSVCLTRELPAGCRVDTVATLRAAKSHLASARYDAVLMDFSLPDGDGAGLIRVLAMSGGRTALFLMTAHNPDDAAVAPLLRDYPQITFIEKPMSFVDVARRVKETVVRSEADEGQRHYGLGLFDLIQAYSLARRSATLRLLTPSGQLATVALSEGELVHASFRGKEGIAALTEIADTKEGRIRLEEGCLSMKRTITMQTQQALLEAHRLLDESRPAFANADHKHEYHLENLDALLDEAFAADPTKPKSQ
jgi:DNA-binding response OmpR family regulator